MDTLDFGAIMEQEYWFEDYDLTCPYCKGSGERQLYTWTCEEEDCGHRWETEDDEDPECPECHIDSIEYEIETGCCEECSGGHFEIMWNTAFKVDLGYSHDWEKSYKIAWDNGFCLIDHNGSHYLLMGSCGQDNTWSIHYTRYQLQGYLDIEDINSLSSSGGHVFLIKDRKRELCEYMKSRIPTPDDYEQSYRNQIDKIDGIMAKGK